MLLCFTRDAWMPWQFQPREMLKWKSTGPRRDSGNIILLPLILDHFQLQHPLSSPYAAKSLKGGPDVIWSCLANSISKTLLKSISSFCMPDTIVLVQFFTMLTWTNTRSSQLVSLTPSYLSPPSWNYPYIHFPHCYQSNLPKTHTWSFHSQIFKHSEFIHFIYSKNPQCQPN